MVSIIGSQVKETSWHSLLKEKMVPLSMEKPTALPLTKKNTIELTGQNIASRTEEYSFKDGIFSVDISGVKRDYYLKGSKAYNTALKPYGYK